MARFRVLQSLCLLSCGLSAQQEEHHHSTPEKLGSVSFPVSCSSSVQEEFNRGIALLHSFAYEAAEGAFRVVAKRDPVCSMAHWGVAIAQFHQLWDPPLTPRSLSILESEVKQARIIGMATEREHRFVDALALIYEKQDSVPYRTRVSNYQRAVCAIAQGQENDAEARVFCALALLSSASPQDRSHGNAKKAAEILEPLFRTLPDHPGIPHYLIHAYDNAELAPQGISAARVYSKIAPSAPHALHMPSHIFTRLGMWDDSIVSNQAARKAAHDQNDTGEELHAMDYLVYAYLQRSRDEEAQKVISELDSMEELNRGDFKIGYAAAAMPIRYAVERGRWAEAAKVEYAVGAPPHVIGLAAWARGIGLARTGHGKAAEAEAEKLMQIEKQLREANSDYWAIQVSIQAREVRAWTRQAEGSRDEAAALMRAAADEEDAIEKLPVTPGPVIPAREQLGYLLLEQKRAKEALKAFKTSLVLAPGRLGAIRGASLAESASASR